jgi:hypothetical protein
MYAVFVINYQSAIGIDSQTNPGEPAIAGVYVDVLFG